MRNQTLITKQNNAKQNANKEIYTNKEVAKERQ